MSCTSIPSRRASATSPCPPRWTPWSAGPSTRRPTIAIAMRPRSRRRSCRRRPSATASMPCRSRRSMSTAGPSARRRRPAFAYARASIGSSSSGAASAVRTISSRWRRSTPRTTRYARATISRMAALCRARSSLLALGAAAMVTAGCATLEKVSTDAKLGLESRITKPVVYRFSGIDPAVRTNLDRARSALAARNYRVAVPLLNRAVWDLEKIHRRGLRLGELVTAYDGLAQAHLALGADDVAQEHRRLSRGLSEAETRAPTSGASQALTKAKDAYVSARFRDAVRGLQQALIELADIPDIDP